jgi:lysozyme
MTIALSLTSARRVCLLLTLAGVTLGVSACSGVPQESSDSVGSAVTSCATGTTIRGVDVSSYQGSINWTSVKAAGISFGFAKATEGTTLRDSTFAANWAGMKAAGVVRGAYHFFHPNESATAQASYVVSTVGALEAGDLPIVLDFEVLDGVSEATAVADAVTFLRAVSSATGKTPIVYMSSEFLSGSYSSLSAYPLWVANYGVSCPGLPSEWGAWKFWQNSDSGDVSGISGGTDVDEFNGSLSTLTAFAGGSGGGGGGGGADAGGGGGSTSCTLDGITYPQNTCTATLQCDDGAWVDRMSDPAACLGSTTTSCTLAGTTYVQNTCTETLQCDSGSWVARSSDPSSCDTGFESNGACLTDTGTVEPQNTCTSTLQCDDGVWVARSGDPAACL